MNFDLPGDQFSTEPLRLWAGGAHRGTGLANPYDAPPVLRVRFDKAIGRGRHAAGCAQAESHRSCDPAARHPSPVAPITELTVRSGLPDPLASCAIN